MQNNPVIQPKGTHHQDVVCLLGMHRSGTSLLARMINLIGVYLGPEGAVTTTAAAYNPKGHWEHEEITQICKAILKRHRGSWDHPPVLPQGWESEPAIEDLRQQFEQLIRDQFAGVERWGWKDPRTCITLPFWQQLLPNMRYIICLRNPVDVAHSLAHRDRFSPEKSSYLWLTYVCLALKQTEGKPRLIVFYEDLIDDCLRELRRIAEFLGAPELANQAKVQEAVLAFVAKGLQHYRTSLAQTMPGSRCDLFARSLYIAQRISLSFALNGTKPQPLDNQLGEALESLSLSAFELSSGARLSAAVSPESDNTLKAFSKQLADLAVALRSQPPGAEKKARALSARLMEIQTQLPRMRDRFGRRLLTRYRHARSYILPMYRHFFRAFRKTSQTTSAQARTSIEL